MSFCRIQWFSTILRKQVGINVILPDNGDGPFPVFYLLHGLSDDFTIWHRRTRIEWYVREMPLIVVMPDGFRGFYTNNEAGPAYADYMALELPSFVERVFPVVRDRRGRCVGGLSMGGYGAFRLALGRPDRYVSATSHSGALMIGSRPAGISSLDPAEMRRIFGRDPSGTEHDLLHLACTAEAKGDLPALRFDCGTEDFLLDSNRDYHRRLTELGVPHEYEEFPGGHSWDYWDTHIRDALAFHARALGIQDV
ncbi:MAG: esterase family protein [Kiritimatiellaeota bacterium]|nr:esterase family protein [Kiritimatiellota bacterium]